MSKWTIGESVTWELSIDGTIIGYVPAKVIEVLPDRIKVVPNMDAPIQQEAAAFVNVLGGSMASVVYNHDPLTGKQLGQVFYIEFKLMK